MNNRASNQMINGKLEKTITDIKQFFYDIEQCRQMAQNPMSKNFHNHQIESPYQDFENFIEGLA